MLFSSNEKQQNKVYRIKTAKKNHLVLNTDVVVTPTTYIRGLLVPNILCKGERQFSVIMKNSTNSNKSSRNDTRLVLVMELQKYSTMM